MLEDQAGYGCTNRKYEGHGATRCLEVMGISSFQYLAVPRIIAASFCLPMLSSIFLFVGNIGSYFVGTKALMIDGTIYFSKLGKWMFVEDIGQGLIKSFFLGL